MRAEANIEVLVCVVAIGAASFLALEFRTAEANWLIHIGQGEPIPMCLCRLCLAADGEQPN